MITKEQIESLYNSGLSQREVSIKLNLTEWKINRLMKKYGIKARQFTTKGLGYKFIGHILSEETKQKISKAHMGKQLTPEQKIKAIRNLEKSRICSPIGTIVRRSKKDYYQRIKVVGNKWKYLHRYVVEQNIGRELLRSEEIHHINFDCRNNDITNLVVLDRKEHLKLHSQLELVMKELMRRGIVIFNGSQYIVV